MDLDPLLSKVRTEGILKWMNATPKLVISSDKKKDGLTPQGLLDKSSKSLENNESCKQTHKMYKH